MATYPPDVERWRPLVAKHFPPELVDKALYVIQGESGGRPDARGDQGVAIGLFQIQDNTRFASRPSADVLLDPESNIAYAAKQLGAAGGNWAPWGEGVTYQGKAFGALGNKPYPGNAVGNTAVGSLTSAPVRSMTMADPRLEGSGLPEGTRLIGDLIAVYTDPSDGVTYRWEKNNDPNRKFDAEGKPITVGWNRIGTPTAAAGEGAVTIQRNATTGKAYAMRNGQIVGEVNELAQTPEQKKRSIIEQQAQASTNVASATSGRSAPAAPARGAAAAAPGAAPAEDFATSVSPGAAGGNRPFLGRASDDPNTMMNEAADPGISTFLTDPTTEGWQSGVKYSPEGDFLGVDFATGPNSSMYIRPEHAQGLRASARSPSSGYVTSYGLKPTANPERDVGTMLAIMSERAVKQREYQNLGLDATKALGLANQELGNKLKAISQAEFRKQLEPQDESEDFVASPLASSAAAQGGAGPGSRTGDAWWEEDPTAQFPSGPIGHATGGSGVGGVPRPTSLAGLKQHESYNPRGGGRTDWVNDGNIRARLGQGRVIRRPARSMMPWRPEDELIRLWTQDVNSGGLGSVPYNPYPPLLNTGEVGGQGGPGGVPTGNRGGYPVFGAPQRPLMMNRGGAGVGGGYDDFATGPGPAAPAPQDDFMSQEELGVFGLGSGKLYSVLGEGRDGLGGETRPERFTVTPTDDFASAAPAARQTQSGREMLPDMSPKARKAFAILGMILTERQVAVLAYIEAHPGCPTVEISRALSLRNAHTVAASLYSDRLVERYAPLAGRDSMHPRWYPKATISQSA